MILDWIWTSQIQIWVSLCIQFEKWSQFECEFESEFESEFELRRWLPISNIAACDNQ